MSAALHTLEFDADTHTYTHNGRKVPSVTQIINAVIPRRHMADEWYLERGRAVHRAIELMNNDALDWDTLDPRIRPQLEAFLKFQKECNGTVIESEIRLVSTRYRFAGTIDALIQHNCEPVEICMTDFKACLEPQVELQLGGYWLLSCEQRPMNIKRGLGLRLSADGGYSCRWFTQNQMARAAATFLNALSLYGWMTANNIKGQNE